MVGCEEVLSPQTDLGCGIRAPAESGVYPRIRGDLINDDALCVRKGSIDFQLVRKVKKRAQSKLIPWRRPVALRCEDAIEVNDSAGEIEVLAEQRVTRFELPITRPFELSG